MMGYWKWLLDKAASMRTWPMKPFTEYVGGAVIVVVGCVHSYYLLRGWSNLVVLKSALIILFGASIMSHAWYREFVV